MRITKYILCLLACLSTAILLAQPTNDIIDLGGENTTVGPLKPPAISQVTEPAAWLTALLRGDSLRLTPGGMFVDVYFAEVTSDPGKITAYESLNIFVFLEDDLAFQDYFLNRVYNQSEPSGRTRPTTNGRESATPGSQASGQTRQATRPTRSSTANQATLNSTGSSDKASLATYPLVRKYAVGQRGLTTNPGYRAKSTSASTMDTDYAARYNAAGYRLELYRLAMVQPSYPGKRPNYLFNSTTELFGFYFLNIIDELELGTQAAMNMAYNTQLLRETQSRMTNLPNAARSAQVLDVLTASYLAKVKASDATFKRLLRR